MTQRQPLNFERIASVLLAVAAAAVVAAAAFGYGWYRSANRPVTAQDLAPADRQALVQELVETSPGSHRWTYFEPRIGYTLIPNEQHDIWDSSFVTNELGFRAPPIEKPDDVYRVLFVGDSWTFGMGVEEEHSYPEVFESLANEQGVAEQMGRRTVQAWTLALPGWSGVSQTSALDFFFDVLQPDAMIIAPSSNDLFTTASVLPNGSTWSGAPMPEPLGAPHHVFYRGGPFASHVYQSRWQETFRRFGEARQRAEAVGVPVFFYFVAFWQPAEPHYWMRKAQIDAPYGAVHPSLTLGRWENDSKVGHGTPEAHRVYAEALYELVARSLDWPLPADHQSHEQIRLVLEPADVPDQIEPRYRRLTEKRNRDKLLDRLEFPLARPNPTAGPIDERTGRLGRATSLLLLRRPDATNVLIETECLANRPFLYPMTLRVTIPSPNGGTSSDLRLTTEKCRQVHEIPMPTDVPAGDALDLVLVADRAADDGRVRHPTSYRLVSVVQR